MSVVLKMFIFPVKRNKNTNTKKMFFYFIFRVRQGLTLLLRIFIRDGKSGYIVLFRMFV